MSEAERRAPEPSPLREACERAVSGAGVPGLVALVARGEQVQVEVHGSLSIGGTPVARDSLFRISSTTKPITAAAAMVLIDEGLMALDEPVERLLPELAGRRVLRAVDGPLNDTVPAVRAATVRELLTFTFGFGMAIEMFAAPEPWPIVAAEAELSLGTLGPPDPASQPDPDTWIERLATLPLIAQPGERWLYNTGLSVLGVLIARAAREPLAQVLRSRILDPLGMHDTSFWTKETGRLATAYRPSQDGPVIFDPPDGAWSRPPRFADGASGLISTADDLLAFARMLAGGGGGVLTPESARAMTSDQLTDAQKRSGGLGEGFFDGQSWSLGQAVMQDGSFGWDGGMGTSWLVDPGSGLVVIVLTQLMFETPALPRIHREIRAAAWAAPA